MSKKRKTAETHEVEFEYTGIEEKDDVPEDVTIVRFHPSVKEVDDHLFQNCEQLKEVVLNEGLQKIGDCSFWMRGSLQSITFPSTITKVSSHAFCWCSGLETVLLNEGLQMIGKNDAFSGCSSLERIAIPFTVDEIDAFTFYGCQRLREVGLHEGVQKIASNAFGSCTSLERFTFPNLSIRMDNIIRVGQTEVEDKIDNIRGTIAQRRGSELFVSVSSGEWRINWQRHGNWETIKQTLDRIDQLLTYYELREATTLLELAMWKSKIDKAETRPIINRDVYRIEIPGPVKNTILQYLNFRV